MALLLPLLLSQDYNTSPGVDAATTRAAATASTVFCESDYCRHPLLGQDGRGGECCAQSTVDFLQAAQSL